MRVHDEIDDIVKRSFAAGLVFGWLLFEECEDLLETVLEIRDDGTDWLRFGTRADQVRDVILNQSPDLLAAELVAFLAEVDLTTDDVDWRLLDHRLMDYHPGSQGLDDHARPED